MDCKHLEQAAHLVGPAEPGAGGLDLCRPVGSGIGEEPSPRHDPEPLEPGTLIGWPGDQCPSVPSDLGGALDTMGFTDAVIARLGTKR